MLISGLPRHLHSHTHTQTHTYTFPSTSAHNLKIKSKHPPGPITLGTFICYRYSYLRRGIMQPEWPWHRHVAKDDPCAGHSGLYHQQLDDLRNVCWGLPCAVFYTCFRLHFLFPDTIKMCTVPLENGGLLARCHPLSSIRCWWNIGSFLRGHLQLLSQTQGRSEYQ